MQKQPHAVKYTAAKKCAEF